MNLLVTPEFPSDRKGLQITLETHILASNGERGNRGPKGGGGANNWSQITGARGPRQRSDRTFVVNTWRISNKNTLA